MNLRPAIAAGLALALAAVAPLPARAADAVPARQGPDAAGAFRINPADHCPVCGMYPALNPKLAASIELADGRAFYACGSNCLFEVLDHPEARLGVARSALRRVLVQEHLAGKPIEAARAWWVTGSDVAGPMGPAPVPLASEADATAFRASHGGEISRRAEPAEVSRPPEPAEAPLRHPLVLAILALHALGLALLVAAAARAVSVLAGRPGGRSASVLGLLSTAAIALASALLVVAIAGASRALAPGAMCGTGVLQAMGGEGGKTLALQALALAVLAVWWTLDALDRATPGSPLAAASSQAALLGLAAQGAASLGTLRSVLALDPNRPVDCCSLVYGRAGSAAQVTGWRLDGAPLLVLAGGLALATLVLAAWTAWRPARGRTLAMALAALATLPLGTLALLCVLSVAGQGPDAGTACPWCLFLPGHGYAGYPLLAALAVAGLEALAAVAAQLAAANRPVLEAAARSRVRAAALRVALGIAVFAALAVVPALGGR